MPTGTSGPRDAKDSKALGPSGDVESFPQGDVPSPKVENLESHELTAREQLMRQWPAWDWETRS